MLKRTGKALIPWLMLASAAAAETPGVSADEILLGTTVDLTGPVAAIGVPLKAGFETATAMINEAGGIKGRKIRVIVEDNGYDTRRAIQAVQKLIDSDEVFGLIGILGGAIAQATQPIIVEAERLNLFPAAPVKAVYDPFERLSFATLTGYDMQSSAVVDYAWDKLGSRKFCTLHQDDESGEQTRHGLEAGLAKRNEKIVEAATYKRGATDFSAQIARLKAADCDVVMLGTMVRETAGAAIEAARLGWKVPMFVTNAGISNAVIALGGEAVEGLYGVGNLMPMSLILEEDEKARAAIEHYKKTSGADKNPDDYFFVAYSAVQMVADTLSRIEGEVTTDSFVAALEQMKDYPASALGAMTFGPDKRLGTNEVSFVKVSNGKWLRAE